MSGNIANYKGKIAIGPLRYRYKVSRQFSGAGEPKINAVTANQHRRGWQHTLLHLGGSRLITAPLKKLNDGIRGFLGAGRNWRG